MVQKWYQIELTCFNAQWTQGKSDCQKAGDFYTCSIAAIVKAGYDPINDFNL